ncbi:MAG TPA: Spy/CpxP family protein refolding chaperone [Longimicrobium sp.]|nr:Spy/CpxP family protein refolding chaperone [Longimicrobium sp.]
MRTILRALALLLGLGMAAAPAHAQEQDHHAAMMEHHRELGLTSAQAERMAAIHTGLAAAMRTHCAQVRAAGGPNAQTHAALHGQMMEAMESAHRQAMAVLTAPQRAKLDSLHAAHHGGEGHDMSAMHAPHDGAAHDSAGMAKMHAEMHGGGAMCSADGAPAETARPRG